MEIYATLPLDYRAKKMIVTDLDGTLAPSKSAIDGEMAVLIAELLRHKSLAVIGGGSYEQFRDQFISALDIGAEQARSLYLFPTCATSMYVFSKGGWLCAYAERLTRPEKEKITKAFNLALPLGGYVRPIKTYGEVLEDRGTQITFSALGQTAPLHLKSSWDPDASRRMAIKAYLEKIIPEFDVRIGGTTSIDVTRKGRDKAYGIRNIVKRLHYGINEMLFIGDALFEGGNDYPARTTGVDCIQISGPEEAKALIRDMVL